MDESCKLFEKIEESASECSDEHTSEQDLEDVEIEDNCDYNDEQDEDMPVDKPDRETKNKTEVVYEDEVIKKARRITKSSIMKSLSCVTYDITSPEEDERLIEEDYLIDT